MADQATGGANAIVDLNNIASVNVNLVSATTLNELEFTEVAAVSVTNGVSGTTLTVTNADQATVHGFAKAGRSFTETITYADTTGTADVAALSVAGTGSSTADSVFNVANANTIESVNLATSGSNYITVNGGTAAAKYTVTGNGTNVLTVGSAATTMTIDASATTGSNIIDVGTLLSTTDSITGGSGFDLLQANLTSGVQMIPTVSGVEELELTFTAAAIYNASKTTGVTDVEITPVGNVNATITNLNESADHIYVGEHWDGSGSAITATGTIAVGYASGSNSDVTFDVGATATDSNPAVSIGAVTFTNNAGALHVHSIGDAANTIGNITANKVSALHIHGETQALTTGNLSATAASEIMVSGDLKNTTAGTIAADESLTALNVISGAGTVTTDTLTQTAGTGAIDTTYTYTGGAKSLTGGGVTASTAAADTDLTAVVNVAAAAGAVTVGALSFTGSGAATGDVTNVTLTAEGTASTGTIGITGLTVNEGDLGTSSTTVDLQGNGGAVTLTALTLTDSDTNSITLNAASSNVTVTTLTNTASTTTDIIVEAASSRTATIGTLAGTGNLNSITATGAGTVSLFAGGTDAVTGDTVVDATGLTGALTLNLASAAGNLNVTMGNVVSGSSNSVTTGAGADVVVGGTGADSINGGAAADNLSGGSGNDSITGGTGADVMSGGTGTNVFTYTALTAQTGTTWATADNITDILAGTDTINVDTAAGTALNFDEIDGSALGSEAAVALAALAALDGVVKYVVVYDATGSGDGYLYYSDLGIAVDAVIQLSGVAAAGDVTFSTIV